MRIVIEYVLPVLMPTVLWVTWLLWRQHRARVLGHEPPDWDRVPWSWLIAAGGVLALLIMVGGTLVAGYSKGHYSPAYVDEKGRIVPGRFD